MPESRKAAEVIDGQVYLTPAQERITGYISPIALGGFDLMEARERLNARLTEAIQRQALDDELDGMEMGEIFRTRAQIDEDVFALNSLAAQLAPYLLEVPVTHEHDD